MVPLQLGGQKPFSASKDLKIEVLRGATWMRGAKERLENFTQQNAPPLKTQVFTFRGRQQHRAWTINIEREHARLAVRGAAIVCPTVSISAHLPAVSAGGFPSISLPQPHSFNQHSGSSLYIFTISDANVLRGCHIFIFTSANALGCLFQVLLRAGYWGVIDVAAAALASGQSCYIWRRAMGLLLETGKDCLFMLPLNTNSGPF